MIKKVISKVNEMKIAKHNEAQYRKLMINAITPAEELEIRAIFTRAQR